MGLLDQPKSSHFVPPHHGALNFWIVKHLHYMHNLLGIDHLALIHIGCFTSGTLVTTMGRGMKPIRDLTADTDFDDANWPEDIYGPIVPVSEHDISVFNEILGDEIDSDFSSSICCCEFCYADFRKRWPNTTFRVSEFQEQSFDTDYLLENSRVSSCYSHAEMSTLRHFVQCLRCDRYANQVWIYEHRFSDVPEIEDEIDALITIGKRTPFLLLEHEFARRVLDQIRRMATSHSKIAIGTPLFRARTDADIAKCGQSPTELATFGPAPAQFVGEGRFNHAGAPLLYVASSPELAAAEIGCPGQPCTVGEIVFSSDMQVLDLADLEDGDEGDNLMLALSNSALISAPRTGEGWMKSEYVFSRFVADCARDAGFDAVRYGSTKLAAGVNYVLLDPAASFETVAKLIGYRPLLGGAPDRRY